ncbi:MAG: response regulator transcription factor, partial [Flavobacteriales bacterium]|nr:response regulator transcription factor [Flavobacteriales bacterium]
MDQVNLLIADSNQLSRCGLASIFGQYDHVQLVGEASSGEQMKEMIEGFDPNVMMIDFTASEFSIDDIPAALRVKKSLKVVAITPEQGALTLISALRAGVKGYIKKDCDLAEITNAVFEVSKGGQFFCGQILETIRKEEIDVDDLDLKEFTCEPVKISARENEIITLIAEGFTNGQIAEKLFISLHTVNTHRKN